MTDRIYYTDSYCQAFDATVTRSFEHEGRAAVALDRTAFYPTSGGQPCDIGTLGGAVVVDVVDADPVVHVISSPLAEGAAVTGAIEWARRFDHMQQHTGQHLLSAAFDRLFGNATVGFHMGADISTIDLGREAGAPEIERAVDEANTVVWEDRAVSVSVVPAAEAMTAGLRRAPARDGPIRLVEIDRFDVCACGGTHVRRTGAVGMIAALAWERQRGGTRLTFVCGGRALRALRMYRDAVIDSTRVLSVLPPELPSAVQRAQAESRSLQKQLADLRSTVAAYEGARLVAEAPEWAGVRIVVTAANVTDLADLKRVAAAAAANERVCAVVASQAAPVSIVVACATGVAVDATGILRGLLDRFGGRGGGRADFAQGGGLDGPVADITAAAQALIHEALQQG